MPTIPLTIQRSAYEIILQLETKTLHKQDKCIDENNIRDQTQTLSGDVNTGISDMVSKRD